MILNIWIFTSEVSSSSSIQFKRIGREVGSPTCSALVTYAKRSITLLHYIAKFSPMPFVYRLRDRVATKPSRLFPLDRILNRLVSLPSRGSFADASVHR